MTVRSTQAVREMFTCIPDCYERVNRILTLGLDSVWRKRAAALGASGGPERCLDVCTGTGETAVELCRRTRQGTVVVALDFSEPMLGKAREKRPMGKMLLCAGDAARLPFAEATFDLVTISFATRNLNIGNEALRACFREFRRVLKPGGRFLNLETSQPPSTVMRALLHWYARAVVRRVGYALSGSRAPYEYLSSTIRRFQTSRELARTLREAGFSKVDCFQLSLGISALHVAVQKGEGNME